LPFAHLVSPFDAMSYNNASANAEKITDLPYLVAQLA
jgi:hypothetical protein